MSSQGPSQRCERYTYRAKIEILGDQGTSNCEECECDCKKIEGRSYAVPPPPPLPEFRLSDEFAFTRVGVDFAGSVFVKDVFSKKGEMNKAYITLFTCATCRAVHLGLVPNLSAESFISALIRFKGRRGTPTLDCQ